MGFDLIKLQYLPYVLGQTDLSKQCRPRSDAAYAASDQDLHCLLLIQQFYKHSQAVKWTS